MLEAIRSRASSWVVKAFLVVLVLSFAVWGIGDVFRGGGVGGAVATVGDIDIAPGELEREFDAQLRRLREQVGTPVDRTQAMQLGLMNQALQTAVARRLVDAHAAELGLTVSDAAVAGMIRDDPMFAGETGFDRTRFEQILRMQSMTEPQFVEDLRADGARGALIGAVAAASRGSTTLAEALWAYREEKRSGRALVVEAAKVDGVATPSDSDLDAWLTANEQRFRAPEMRRFTLVSLLPADLAAEITIAEDRVREAYDQRIDEYRVPESRDIEQLLAPDEATITTATERAQAGESFAVIAESMAGQGVRRELLADVAAGALPAVFETALSGLATGAVSAPVKSDFGWHLFRIEALEPARTEPFEAKRDGLARELALAQAEEGIPDLVASLEDQMAGGASLEDAGKAVGARIETLGPVAADGSGPDGLEPLVDPLPPVVLGDAFSAQQGQIGPTRDLPDGGVFALRVDAVEPERPRALDEVRAEVEAGWLEEKRLARAKEVAAELHVRATGGASLESLTEGRTDATVRAIPAVVRNSGDPVLGPAVVTALFATAPGAVAAAVVNLEDGAAVVATDAVVPAPEPTELDTLTGQLGRGMQGDLLAQYEGALRSRFAVEVDQRVLAAMIGAGGTEN